MTPTVLKTLGAVRLPATVDTEGACEIIEELEGQRPAQETLRRWPIRYRLRGRIRTYEVDDVIAHARTRFEQAPVRVAAAASKRPRPRRPATESLPESAAP